MRIVWAPLAERRVQEALQRIAEERLTAAAQRWLERLLASVEQLATFPQRGRMVPEVNRPEIREVIVAPYRVVYRREPKRVIVLTVRHVRRAFEVGETR